MKLTGKQWKQLQDALVDAFTDQSKLAQMVQVGLEKRLNTIAATGGDLGDTIFSLITYTEAHNKTSQLIDAARNANPDNPDLLSLSIVFGLAPSLPPGVEPEAIVRATVGFIDVEPWLSHLGLILPKVCRVEIESNKGPIYGTGFLLGSDTLITNYHVMEAVIRGEQGSATSQGESAKSGDVVLRFDYKRLADGTTLNPGTEYQLPAQGWLLDSSPFADLDYALLRVSGAPGTDPVGGQLGAPTRDFLTPVTTYKFQPDTPLFIVQHPQGDPLQMALDMNAIIGVNADNTRVTYRTNTLPGSSGSPCFNSKWELVALHHAGDPNFAHATYNEGIPFAAIMSRLKQNNKLDGVGK